MIVLKHLSRIFRRKNLDIGTFEAVEPREVGPLRSVPSYITKPSYYDTGIVLPGPDEPEIKNSEQLEAMAKSCKLASSILKSVGDFVKVGVTTDDIDKFVHDLSIKHGAYPSPLRYKDFPKSICTSVNNVACHGIPDNRPLADGDIINVDITVFLNNYHGDCSKTFMIGNVSDQGKEIISVAEECLYKGISICGPDVPFNEIGFVIENHAAKYGFSILPAFLGHGIGSYFHGPPDIYHTKNRYPGVMKPGMTFTIEPAVSNGGQMVELLEDGWTAVSLDGSRSAQTEHTIQITDNGYTILTN